MVFHINLIALLSCIITLFYSQANAAAWTQGKGHGQAIISLEGYQSANYFDDNSNIKDSGSKFIKYEINPFFEYGLTDDITIGINPMIQYWQNDKPQTSATNNSTRSCNTNGFTSGEIIESEFFVRKKLLDRNNAVVSIQPLVKTPCLRINDGDISVLGNSYDLELRILGGYGFKWDSDGRMRPFTGQYHFVNLESAYRKRHGDYSDQIKIDGTAGFRFNKDVLILGQVFSVISTGKEIVGTTEVTQNIFIPRNDNYYNLKLQLSGVVQMTKTSSFQLGVYTDALGKNYGQGTGVLAAIWKGF